MVTVKQYHPSNVEKIVNSVFLKLEKSSGLGAVLWLCPNHRLIRVRTSQLAGFCESQSKKAVEMPLFATINDFAFEHAKYTLKGKKALSRLLQEMVVRNLVAGIADLSKASAFLKRDFSSLEAYAKASTSFIQEIKSHTDFSGQEIEYLIKEAISELKEEDYPRLDSGRWERIEKRALYPVKVFKAYTKLLSERDFFDTEDAVKVAPEKAGLENKLLILDSFLDFEPHELGFIKRLIEIAVHSLVLQPVFEIGYFNHESEVFQKFNPPYVSTIAHDNFEESYQVKHECFFSIDDYETQAVEVREIAMKVRSLVERGCPPERICITFPEVEKCASLIAAALKLQDIKFNLSRGKELANRPRARFFLQALDACIFDFDARIFCNFLFNPELKVLSVSEKSSFIKSIFGREIYTGVETLLSSAAKLKSHEAFKKIYQLLLLLKALEEKNSLNDVVKTLIELSRFAQVLPEIEPADPSKQKEIEAVSEALESCALLDREDLFPPVKGINSRDPKKILILAGGLFSAALASQSSIQVGDISEGVQVTGFLESRGSSFDYVFVGGLSDEQFPGKPARDIFLSEAVRKKLGLPLSLDFYMMRKREFWRLVSSSREGIFFSWHRKSGNQENIRSRFLDELELIFKRQLKIPSGTKFKRLKWQNLKVKERKKVPVVLEANSISLPDSKTDGKPIYQVSDILTYRKCNYRFKLKKELGVFEGRFPDPFLSSRTIGNLVHRMIASFAGKQLSSPDRLEELRKSLKKDYDATIRFIAEELKKAYENAVFKMCEEGRYEKEALERIISESTPRVERFANHLSRFIAERMSESVRIESEKEIRKDLGMAIISGRIDWLEHIGPDTNDGSKSIIIRDFKVTSPKEELKSDDRIQVNIYRELLGEDEDKAGCGIVYVNEVGLRSFPADYTKRTKKHDLESTIASMISGITEKIGDCQNCELERYCWYYLEKVWA